MPTSARTTLGFFAKFADVGIRAPEQKRSFATGFTSLNNYGRVAPQPGRLRSPFKARLTLDGRLKIKPTAA